MPVYNVENMPNAQLIAQLESNNQLYWKVRNRVRERQKELSVPKVERNRVRYETSKLIKSGEIVKSPCQICGEESEVHYETYQRADKVSFLCAKHHREIHREMVS